MPFNKLAFKIALATHGLTQRAFALQLGVKPSTLSEWMCGVNKPPSGFARRVERVLKMPKGSFELPSPAPRRSAGVK